MKRFTLLLAPPADSLSYDNRVTVYLTSRHSPIGHCDIDRDEDGQMVGVFTLNHDVDDTHFVYYMFDFIYPQYTNGTQTPIRNQIFIYERIFRSLLRECYLKKLIFIAYNL